jgi:hypothetical protein
VGFASADCERAYDVQRSFSAIVVQLAALALENK